VLENRQVDVVVVGSGGAGLTAAIEAAERGMEVVVLEKMARIGGNTIISSGWISAAGTCFQANQGIKDSPDIHLYDTLRAGGYKNDKELVQVLVTEASRAIHWAIKQGVIFEEEVRWGRRASRPRQHVCSPSQWVKRFKDVAVKKGVKILTRTRVVKITKREVNSKEKVLGVVTSQNNARLIEIETRKGVILATGGFGANPEMVRKYNPKLKYLGTTNASGVTGDGILLADEVGVRLIHMEYIQSYPLCDPRTGRLSRAGELGVILVNQEGMRFVNETETRDVRSSAIMKQTGGIAFSILDEKIRTKQKKNVNRVGARTIRQLAEKNGVKAQRLIETVKKFNRYVVAAQDSEFGRKMDDIDKLETPPFYAIKVTPSVHYTLGGVAINTEAQVLRRKGGVISSLYAAGEVTGGVHRSNREGGNALVETLVFGRIAGRNVAKEKGRS